MSDPRAEVYKLAFDQSAKALQSQVGTVDGTRARIGVLMGSGNLATAFLGKDALAKGFEGGTVNLLFAGGFLAFALFAAICLWAFWPREDWVFSLSAAGIMSRVDSPTPMSVEEVYKDLATWQEHHFDQNAYRLKGLFAAVQWASVALVVELAFFLAVVAGVRIG